MSDGVDHLAGLLGRAAMDVWGDMPRDIQEALFETAMKGHATEREEPRAAVARAASAHAPSGPAGMMRKSRNDPATSRLISWTTRCRTTRMKFGGRLAQPLTISESRSP